MSATDELRRMLDERGVPYETNDDMGASETRWNGFTAYQLTPNAKLVMHPTPEQAIAATLGGGTLTVEQVEEAVMNAEHQEPNPDCSAMLYKMFTENMKYEPCKDYEPKDDVSGYGADFNIVEPNFDNLKVVEMDASRLVANEPDSRDKLEADVRKIAEAYNMDSQRHGTERFAHELYYSIIHLLDRQAAITERETTKRHELFCETCEAESDKQIAELTAERNKLQEQLRIGWECECNLQAERDKFKEANDYHAAQYELASEDCDRLQAQVDELMQVAESKRLSFADRIRFVNEIDELKAERVKLRSQICKLEDDLVGTSDERDNWKEHSRTIEYRCKKAETDCEIYRKKFGKCLDYADAIHALMDDEGMA